MLPRPIYLNLSWINHSERTVEMPDQLCATWWPGSENGQQQMMQSKVRETHIIMYPRGDFWSFLSAHECCQALRPWKSLYSPRKQKNQGLCVLLNVSLPFSSPTELLTTKTHCGKDHFHWARSSPLHTFKCIFQFHSVFLFSYNKVELLILTPSCLPWSLFPYPPSSNLFSTISIAKSPPASHRYHSLPASSPHSNDSFTSSLLWWKNPFLPCWFEWLLLCCRHLFVAKNTDLFCTAYPTAAR